MKRTLLVPLAFLLLLALVHAGCQDAILNPEGNTISGQYTLVGPDGREYSADGAPANSILRIVTTDTYVAHCENGAKWRANPPLVIRVADAQTGDLVYDTSLCGLGHYWCSEQYLVDVISRDVGEDLARQVARATLPVDGFDGPLSCKTNNYLPWDAVPFARAGTYDVNLYFSKWSVNPLHPEFKDRFLEPVSPFPVQVRILNPLVSVTGPTRTSAALDPGAPERIAWTAVNHSGETVRITGASAECPDGISCAVEQFEGLDYLAIPPGGSAILTQRITATAPGTPGFDTRVSLEYTDDDDVPVITRTARSPIARVETGSSISQSFSIRVTGGSQSQCMRQNAPAGEPSFGYTGQSALPRTLLSWKWNEVAENACDATNPDYVYCDAAQFSIALSKRMLAIEEITLDPARVENELPQKRSFDAYLMQDGLSHDFQSDFAQHYLTQTFAALSPEERALVQHVFGDPAHTRFYLQREPENTLSRVQLNAQGTNLRLDPGRYRVQIVHRIADTGTPRFVAGNAANADVNVILIPLFENPPENPFYYLPFDGLLGIDDTGIPAREGYGARARSDGIRIKDDPDNVQDVTIAPGVDATALVRANVTGNDALLRPSGNLLALSRGTTPAQVDVALTPSSPNPVYARINAIAHAPNTSRAFLYYALLDAQTNDVLEPEFDQRWLGTGTTANTCTLFDGNPLSGTNISALAGALSCESALSGVPREQAYGFAWTGMDAAKAGDALFAKTLFYTHPASEVNLAHYCTTTEPPQYWTLSEPAGTTVMTLDNRRAEMQNPSLAQLFALVESGDACLSTQGSSAQIWWNDERLFRALDGAHFGSDHPLLQSKCQ